MQNIQNNLVDDLRELLKRLRAEKQMLDERISRLEKDIASLSGVNSRLPVLEIKTKRRRPRGANLSLVRNFLNDDPSKKYSVPEISDAVDIPRTSTWATLKRLEKSGDVKQDSEGYWKKS